MANYSRRLPVYLVLDCSESMAGPAIDSVNQGVQLLVNELKGNPLALETAYLSVITFSREARQVVPLTELLQFQPPKLTVRAGSSLGAALRLLLHCMQKEVIRTTATTKGDYKPLVFLLTDGQPTDDWEPAADAIRAANNPRIANIYAIGCGPDVDYDNLRRVTDIALQMTDLSPEAFRKFFVWLSASVQSASLKVGSGATDAFGMPDLPAGAVRIAPEESGEYDPTPRQVFLNARCSKSGKPYLMRFGLRPYDRRYEAISAHPMEYLEEEGDESLLPPINSSLLDGCPDCPHCENPAAAACPCGILFCADPAHRGPVTCPKCRARLVPGGGGSFDIHQRSSG